MAHLTSLAALTLAATGCTTHHRFEIASINSSDSALPQHSYRLVDARPGARPGDLRFAQVARDVRTALSARGLYAAPEGTPSDLVIEVDYDISAPVVTLGIRREPYLLPLPASASVGVRPSSQLTSAIPSPRYLGEREVPFTITTYRKSLRLTAREARRSEADAAPRQVWSVLVTNEDGSDDLRKYTRLMVAAAMDHIGMDHPTDQRVVLTRHDARVTFVERGTESS